MVFPEDTNNCPLTAYYLGIWNLSQLTVSVGPKKRPCDILYNV